MRRSTSHQVAGLFGFLIVVLICSGPVSAQQSQFKTKAKTAILIEGGTGATLFQKDADTLFPPASMSKLVTLAVVFKALKARQLQMSDEFVMSEHAWRTGGAPSRTSAMFVPLNKRASLNELLQGIIVQSGNDAAIAIAEGLAGSEAAFAKVMTNEARRIGLTRSTFANPTGLNHPDQLMTARELAKLADHIIREYPELYKMFAQKRFNYRKHRFVNRNRLLFSDLGVDGLKTGYVKASGYGVVLSAVRGGRRLITVLGGLATANERWAEARRIIEWGFKGFKDFRIFDGDQVVGQARVWGGTQIFVPLVGQKPINVVLPRFPVNQKLRAEVVYATPLKPPVARGDRVATLRVTSTTGTINEVPLYAAEDVGKGGTMRQGLDSLFTWRSAGYPDVTDLTDIKRGRFITFEGGEGTGKSTQVKRLAARLNDIGISSIETREPGGSPFAERIRGIILDPDTPPHPPLAEALLFSAARADHIATTISPALAAGRWVICDRFLDSTRAYQGAAGGLTSETLNQLEHLVVGDAGPDLTIVLDIPVNVAFSRVSSRAAGTDSPSQNDPYERRSTAFHEALRQGFLDIAKAEPNRCIVIDAAPAADQVADQVWAAVHAHFPEIPG